jgi:hypothetical protein
MAQQINGEQLRAEIDSGRTGEKVGFPDPAAAPLGTDAEAGGHGTSFKSEARVAPPSRGRGPGIWLVVLGIAVVGAIALFVVLSGNASR